MTPRFRPGTDLRLAAAAGLLCLVSLPALYSALRSFGASLDFADHLWRIGLAAGLGLLASRVNYRRLARLSPVFFAVVLGLSAYATLAAGLRAGTRRWLDLGAITVQPGELAKLALVLLLAQLIARSARETLSRQAVAAWTAASAALVLAVATQPDLGSAAILTVTALGMAALGGLFGWKHLRVAAAAGVVLVPAAWFWGLRGYQRERLLAFLSPESDPLGAGYQTLQASIAVGSGGFFGAGWLEGSQTGYQFLPAPHTDFIFAVLAEEFGFLGVVAVLCLYLWLGSLLLSIAADAASAGDQLGALLAGGVFFMLLSQTLYNIGMVAGLVPVKGFPLPLLSYGGNSLLVTGAALGLAAAVHRGTNPG